jgi:hypothetical protein
MNPMRHFRRYVPILGLSVMTGCATVPEGPSVAVMPSPGKPFEVFRADDRACRAYAAQATGQTTNQAGAANMVGAMAVSTAVGAATGAVLGGHHGAQSGAAVGLIGGTVYGAGLAGQAQSDAQRRYDIAYEQCMYAKGNQLPMASSYGGSAVVAPNGPRYYPPASYPPPPPP